MHIWFLSFFTVSIVFNLAYVFREDEGRNPIKHGFSQFFQLLEPNIIGPLKKKIRADLMRLSLISYKLDFLKSCLPTMQADFQKTDHSEGKSLERGKIDELIGAIKELQPHIDGLANLEYRQISSHNNIHNFKYISSACFLLGLYTIFMLFCIPFENPENLLSSPDVIRSYILCGDILCFLFLFGCLFHDYANAIPDDRARNAVIKMVAKKVPKPTRRRALLLYLFIFAGGVFFFIFDINIISTRFSEFASKTFMITAFTCYSAFVVYFVYYFIRSSMIRLRGYIMRHYYMDKEFINKMQNIITRVEADEVLSARIGVRRGAFSEGEKK